MIYMSGTRTRSSISVNSKRMTAYESSASTLLAQDVAPPFKKPDYTIFSLILCGIVFLVWHSDIGFLFKILWMSICFYCVWFLHKESVSNAEWNETEYPKLYEEWSKTYLCNKCGKKFKF